MGISDQTISNWRKEPEFAVALAQARKRFLNECVSTAEENAAELGPLAIDVLRAALAKGSIKTALAIAKSQKLFAPAPKAPKVKIVVEFGDVNEPLQGVEEAPEENPDGN